MCVDNFVLKKLDIKNFCFHVGRVCFLCIKQSRLNHQRKCVKKCKRKKIVPLVSNGRVFFVHSAHSCGIPI